MTALKVIMTVIQVEMTEHDYFRQMSIEGLCLGLKKVIKLIK